MVMNGDCGEKENACCRGEKPSQKQMAFHCCFTSNKRVPGMPFTLEVKVIETC